MIKLLWILCLIATLTACCCQHHRYTCFDQYARCEEIKKRIIYFDGAKHDLNGASNVQMSSVAHDAELESLHRAYRENGCV